VAPGDLKTADFMIVRKLRLQRGWSQEQLAELAGVNVRTIQRIERGTKMSLETRSALASVFEVDVSTLEPGATQMTENVQVTSDERQAIEYVKGVKEFYTHLAIYLVFAVLYSVMFGFGNPIIFWGIVGWGVGVIVHGLNVYEVINLFGAQWEKRQIEKRLGRKL
jgi:XRE family transcriptional regulator, regulator of sulfur utilization